MTVVTVARDLKSICAFITKGATPTTYGFKWEQSGVPFLRSECVSPRGLDMSQAMFISPSADIALSRSRVRDGDILMTITGNVGRLVKLEGLGSANINQHIARVRVIDPEFDPDFVYHYLSQPNIRAHYESITTGLAYPQISLAQVRSTLIPALPISQQIEIAEALTAVSDFVAALEQLIAKKRDVKLGMMQQLLAGDIRLPGHHGAWQRVTLGDVAFIDPESLRVAATPRTALIDYISLEDVSRGSILGSTAYRFADAPSRARRKLRPGDVLFGTVRPSLQSHALLTGGLSQPVASTGFAVIRARPGTSEPRFIAQWVLGIDVSTQVDRITTGSNYPAVSSGDVRALEVSLPPLEEQRAIGDVLNEGDLEIAALERRLESVRLIRQGMMQELLTGRSRLTAEEVAA